MVCLLLVDSFTYPGCLRPVSSGSPGGSDSPGCLSPDHPHPGSATLISPRIISQIICRDRAPMLASWSRDTTCSGHKHSTPIDEKAPRPSISEEHVIFVNMLIIHIKHNKVCNVLLVIMEHTKRVYIF